MNCKDSNDNVMKFFDKNCNDIENIQFRQHLKSCKKCSEDFEKMDEIFNFLQEDGIVEPPEDFETEVMGKIGLLEGKRREKTAKSLVILYNMTALISIVLLMVFVTNLKEIDVFKTLKQLGACFSSFSSVQAALFSIFKAIYELAAEVITMLFQICFTIIRLYYYVILILLALLLAIQKMFTIRIDQNEGGRR